MQKMIYDSTNLFDIPEELNTKCTEKEFIEFLRTSNSDIPIGTVEPIDCSSEFEIYLND